MTNRLSSVDVSYLYLEEPTTVMNVGSVLILEPSADFSADTLVDHIAHRIAYTPRYRQRLKWVPGRLANPLWVDDPRFDIASHIVRTGLPHPGGDRQLDELVARVLAQPLDRNRPLWEVHVVEGLSADRIALVTKCHQALVDGVNAVELSQVVLDATPAVTPAPPDTWHPDREPSVLELVSGAVTDAVRRPSQVIDTVRSGIVDLQTSSLGSAVGSVLSALGTVRPAPESPLNVEIGRGRRFARVDSDLAVYREIRRYYADGGRVGSPSQPTISVNDVLLATLAGGLREWMLTRGVQVGPQTTLRALVPLSVGAEPGQDASDRLGFGAVPIADLEAFLVDLPIGEPNPALRLMQVAYQTKAHAETGRGVPARVLAGIGGFGPSTVHSLGARLANRASKRVFNLLVTNVPGPQEPLYAAGAKLLQGYPVIPLARGQGLAVGITSYDGGVYFGLNGDRDALPDIALLAECIDSALTELRSTVPARPARRPRAKGATGRAGRAR